MPISEDATIARLGPPIQGSGKICVQDSQIDGTKGA